jgi:hypothetical protein
MTMLIPESNCCKSFSYCVIVMTGYCGQFHQMSMISMLKVDGKSTMNVQRMVKIFNIEQNMYMYIRRGLTC